MYRVGGTGIDIERDPHFIKAVFNNRVVFVNYLLRGHAFLHRTNSNRNAMFITSAYKLHISFLRTQVTNIYISGYITTCKMSYVHGSVRIGQGSGDKVTFE